MPLKTEPKRYPGQTDKERTTLAPDQAPLKELKGKWQQHFQHLGLPNWKIEEAVRDIILSSPLGSGMMATGLQMLPYKHTQIMNEYIWRAARGEIRRLIIETPPQHGKSTISSHHTPAWHLGQFPDQEIILASYEARFARQWGRRARDVIETFGEEFFGIRVDPSSRAAESWKLKGHMGAMHCAGAGGPLTGKGASLGIIDDPFKNDKEALSELMRQNKFDWFNATFSTRIRHGGAIILVNTRWHLDDLAGRLQAQEDPSGDPWVVLSMPALALAATPGDGYKIPPYVDPLGRAAGDPLCPQLFTLADLLSRRTRLGDFWFNSLYQQRPITLDGGLFKQHWMRVYNNRNELPVEMEFVGETWPEWQVESFPFEVPHGKWVYKNASNKWGAVVISVDCKGLGKGLKNNRNSYVVIQVWGAKGAYRYLLDQFRFQADSNTTKKAVLAMCRKWPMASVKLIEAKAAGPEVINEFHASIPGIIPILPEQQGGSKEGRASAVAWQFQAGNVFIPHRSVCPWIVGWLAEMGSFPMGSHDDQVDACTQALYYLQPSMPSTGQSVLSVGTGTDFAALFKRIGR